MKIFFSPTFTISYRAFWSFLTVEYAFSRSERRILRYFFFDGIHFYFLSWDSFFSCEILLFFLWHILLLGQFSNLCLGQFEIFSDRKCYIFLRCFFLSGNIFQNYVPLPVCYSFLIFIKKYPLIHTYPYVPFWKIKPYMLKYIWLFSKVSYIPLCHILGFFKIKLYVVTYIFIGNRVLLAIFFM